MGVKVEGMWPCGEVRGVLPKQLKGKDDFQWKYPGGTYVFLFRIFEASSFVCRKFARIVWKKRIMDGGAKDRRSS